MVAKSARIEVDHRPTPERRYRVIVCGTGGVGSAVVREALRLPWIDVVGVQVYTSAKAGVDAGELVGLPAAGIMTTADPDEIAALDADCVLYCARDFGDWRSNDVLVRLLESGKNVVTSLAYFRAESHTPEVVERLEEACRRGGTSLHATGLNPGYIGERLGVVLTGLSHDVSRIKIEEFYDITPLSSELAHLLGIGLPVSESEKASAAAQLAQLYLEQTIGLICDALGIEIDGIEHSQAQRVAGDPIQADSYAVAEGAVASVTHRWTALVDGRPFLLYETTWFVGKSMQPEHSDVEHHWLLTIEGRPSVRMLLEVNASMESGAANYEGDPTSAGNYAIGIPLVQAITRTCESAPGIIGPPPVGPHWTAARGRSEALTERTDYAESRP
jgi:2,4-diaminopentanoate dehydrogenase